MFCPECGCEYRPGYLTCADCRVPLVESPGATPAVLTGRDVEPVLLCTLDSPADAAFTRSLLDGAGLPYSVGGELLPRPYGVITLHVRRGDLSRARELLASLDLPSEVTPASPADGKGNEVGLTSAED